MQALLDRDVVGDLSSTISALHDHIETITKTINRLNDDELGHDAGVRLCRFAERLDLLAMHAVRSAISIRKTPAAARTPAYEWDLEAALDGRQVTDRGHSLKRMHGMPAGTSFVIDDFRVGELGVRIGVVWETPERPFTWLSPHEFRACTQSIEG